MRKWLGLFLFIAVFIFTALYFVANPLDLYEARAAVESGGSQLTTEQAVTTVPFSKLGEPTAKLEPEGKKDFEQEHRLSQQVQELKQLSVDYESNIYDKEARSRIEASIASKLDGYNERLLDEALENQSSANLVGQ